MTNKAHAGGADESVPSLTHRVRVAAVISLVVAAYVWWFGFDTGQLKAGGSDFDQLWYAARALIEGREPYDAVGPGRDLDWRWPLLYPMPAVLAAVPFAFLPLVAARVAFSAISAGLLSFALTKRGHGLLPILASASMLDAARAGQLSPLITASILIPALAWIVALKPTLGAIPIVSTSSLRAIFIAATGSAFLIAVSFAANPDWLERWFTAARSVSHFRTPLFSFGGPFLLLAASRWRRLDARILLACACIPHTPSVYDVLPLGLIARDLRESLAFALLTFVALLAQDHFVTTSAFPQNVEIAARILNLTVYLPALAAVLLRPNDGRLPALATIVQRRHSGAAQHASRD